MEPSYLFDGLELRGVPYVIGKLTILVAISCIHERNSEIPAMIYGRFKFAWKNIMKKREFKFMGNQSAFMALSPTLALISSIS